MREKIPTRQISIISMFVATGVVTRIGLGRIALAMPVHVYGVLIKIGLTETLTFVCGYLFGAIQGFVVGALIIVVSDLFMVPGPWTPFIAVIIGLLGVGGWALRKISRKENPGTLFLAVSAVILTLISELLQNIWFAYFFSIPIVVVLAVGVPSTVTALINNVILFKVLGQRIIRILPEMIREKSG